MPAVAILYLVLAAFATSQERLISRAQVPSAAAYTITLTTASERSECPPSSAAVNAIFV